MYTFPCVDTVFHSAIMYTDNNLRGMGWSDTLTRGAGDSNHCLGNWFATNVVSGIKSFGAQFGYYGYRALYPFEEVLRETASVGNPVHLVFGSNKGSLIEHHLEWTLELIDGTPDASLTVVVYSNAEFHPKTVHVKRSDDSQVAVVGSANLTEAGMGLNVEAGLEVDTQSGDDAGVLNDIETAIQRWATVNDSCVFHISSKADITALKAAGLIGVSQPSPPRPGTGGSSGGGTSGIGSRTRLWIPGSRPPSTPGGAPKKKVAKKAAKKAPPPPAPAYPTRWFKELRSSDAQQVRPGTNPTGKLRLAQAGHPIDHRRYFRYQLFGTAAWNTIVRAGNDIDVADIEFDVIVRGRSLGKMTLTVDHAPHREAGQNNVPSVLAWGPLNRILTRTSHVGDWVVIDRDASGEFKLTIQSTRP